VKANPWRATTFPRIAESPRGQSEVGPRARPRPPLFRALGAADPPLCIEVDGRSYRRVEILKHDSWAATAIYRGAAGRIVCKFNRQQSILGIPMRWLGRFLARREATMLRRLENTGHVPRLSGAIAAHGRSLPYAVAHAYVAGHPLSAEEQVADGFFPALQALLRRMHAEGMAYVDLHKRENIIVGDDGRPYLIDFQISLALSPRWLGSSNPCRAVLRLFQAADDYHLLKHWVNHRADQCGLTIDELTSQRPWWIRAHRSIAIPFRTLRRMLLVALRIRTGEGMVASECFAEDAVRNDPAAMRQRAAA
jgi:hypothetical protein